MFSHLVFFRQILLIGGSNPAEDVEKFKDKGYAMIWGPFHQHTTSTVFQLDWNISIISTMIHNLVLLRSKNWAVLMKLVFLNGSSYQWTQEYYIKNSCAIHHRIILKHPNLLNLCICVSEQTLWLRHRGASKICSGESLMVWTWPAQLKAWMCWF